MAGMLELSVVVPLFNEEDNVVPLYESLSGVLEAMGPAYELIFVNDGSTDRTVERAAELAETDRRLRIINFRRNYGQTPAMAAGIDFARGKIIVTMDGDQQNDPRDIRSLINVLEEGYDLAVGWRHNRQDKLVTRKIPSVIANWIIGKITGIPIKDNGCSLKAYRADVIKSVPLYSDMHRFIPAMASVSGARVAEVKVRHHPRRFGESKYGLARIYRVLFDLLSVKTVISFSSRPLVWFTMLSIPAFAASFVCLAYSFWVILWTERGMGVSIAGSGILFAALGIFLLLNGALGELVYRSGDLNFSKLAQLTMDDSRVTELSGSPTERSTQDG
jgi:glycosyltransferase involved in cell wall biosynthesis